MKLPVTCQFYLLYKLPDDIDIEVGALGVCERVEAESAQGADVPSRP